MIRMRSSRRTISLVIAADQAALYNIFTAAGSPTDAVDVTVTLNAGKVCKSGMTTDTGWAGGSTVKLVNLGTIAGQGGDGAQGDGFIDASHVTGAHDGSPGGHALDVHCDITIDNGSGLLAGGGGGGGGGGIASSATSGGWNGSNTVTGSGAGAGRGYNNANGGAAGANGVGGALGDVGTNGSSAGPGTGGIPEPYAFPTADRGGRGGDGGDWGQPGSSGSSGSASTADPGGSGGAAGKAVNKNGFTVTFTAGNDATHVKGAVS